MNKNLTIVDKQENGFVLVSVIWIAGLLAVVATAFIVSVRSHTLAGSNIIHNAKAEAAADGMALFTAFRLATDANVAFKLNGDVSYCRWQDNINIAISIQDQGGLVDLNTASPELLGALLGSLGPGKDQSTAILSALQDFRDPDSQSASGGVEVEVFPGKNYGPKNAPLAIPEEIDQVPELDETLFHRLMPFVTTYSQQPGIDFSRAPQQLLALLGDGDFARQFASPSASKTFGIDIIAELKNGSRFRRQAFISLMRQPHRPFAVLTWRRGRDHAEPAPFPKNAQPCFN